MKTEQPFDPKSSIQQLEVRLAVYLSKFGNAVSLKHLILFGEGSHILFTERVTELIACETHDTKK